MENSPWAEMMVAAREQMKITELRLKKLNLRFGAEDRRGTGGQAGFDEEEGENVERTN